MQQHIETSASFESQISRSITSSPLPSDINPLTVRVNASPIQNTEQSECLTPIKKDAQFDISNNEQNENNKVGLLTYSTPIVYSQLQHLSAFSNYELLKRSTPYTSFNSLFNSQTQSSIRKPRVNFHSIDDLANSDKSETQEQTQNDSGISSYILSNASSKINVTSSFESSPAIIQAQFAQKIDEAENEDKENIENKKQANDNGKKIRTTFTDQQKKALDAYFRKNPYPDPKETEDLSQELVLPENVIKVWFQNKRSRDKQRKFSHKSRNVNQNTNTNKNENNFLSSPIVANLQLLSSRLNSYAAVAAAVVNASNPNYYQQKFFN